MKQNHVNFSDAEAKEAINHQSRLVPVVSNLNHPFLVGDIRFLVVLLQTFASPRDACRVPEMWFPEDMMQILSEPLKKKMDIWVHENALKQSDPDEDIINEVFALKHHHGLHFSEYISILTAHKRKMQIISCSRCITEVAARFNLCTTDGKILIQQMKRVPICQDEFHMTPFKTYNFNRIKKRIRLTNE